MLSTLRIVLSSTDSVSKGVDSLEGENSNESSPFILFEELTLVESFFLFDPFLFITLDQGAWFGSEEEFVNEILEVSIMSKDSFLGRCLTTFQSTN